jgi:hypothetical protein
MNEHRRALGRRRAQIHAMLPERLQDLGSTVAGAREVERGHIFSAEPSSLPRELRVGPGVQQRGDHLESS